MNGKKLNIGLKRRVDVRFWNSQKQRINGKSEKVRKINQYLDEVYAKLFQCYQELRSENKPITPQTIKSRYTGDDKIGHYTLRDIIECHNTSMFEKLHGNTSRLYLTSQKYILLFVKKKYKVDDFELASLDYTFILNFESFLRTYSPQHYKKRIGNNAVMKHIQRLRRMVSLAYQLEWIDRDPFVKFKQKLTPTYRGFLTPEELKQIEELQIESTRLKLAKDLFVFSCYTGISYIDVMLLTNESLVLGLDKTYLIMTK
nr:site-specific integrase [Flagellimonas sp. CMM7]